MAGVFASRYTSLLSSLVLMCPAGINAPKLSDFISEIASGGKNYLLPESPEDFKFMLKKVSHRKVFMPFFICKIMCAARQQSNAFYEKGNYQRHFLNATDFGAFEGSQLTCKASASKAFLLFCILHLLQFCLKYLILTRGFFLVMFWKTLMFPLLCCGEIMTRSGSSFYLVHINLENVRLRFSFLSNFASRL